MTRPSSESNARMNLRLQPEAKATIAKAAAILSTDLTDFMVQTALRSANEVIARAEQIELSARDSQRVMDLLDNPPKPNSRLLAAAGALPKA